MWEEIPPPPQGHADVGVKQFKFTETMKHVKIFVPKWIQWDAYFAFRTT